jgi:hypothetical protein
MRRDAGDRPNRQLRGKSWRRSCSEPDWREPYATLFASQVFADLSQHFRHRHVEGTADRGEQLTGGFLATALYLGEIAERDSCRAADIAKRPRLVNAVTTQDIADQAAQQHHASKLLVTTKPYVNGMQRFPARRHTHRIPITRKAMFDRECRIC